MPLSDIIRASRAKKGLTQADLAEQMAITRQTIINWEKGVTNPDANEVKTLSKVLGIDEQELSAASADTPDEIQLREEIYRELIERNSEYRLVPKTILDEEYRIVLKSELDDRAEMWKEALKSKNLLIAQLEREIAELRAGQRSVAPHAKQA